MSRVVDPRPPPSDQTLESVDHLGRAELVEIVRRRKGVSRPGDWLYDLSDNYDLLDLPDLKGLAASALDWRRGVALKTEREVIGQLPAGKLTQPAAGAPQDTVFGMLAQGVLGEGGKKLHAAITDLIAKGEALLVERDALKGKVNGLETDLTIMRDNLKTKNDKHSRAMDSNAKVIADLKMRMKAMEEENASLRKENAIWKGVRETEDIGDVYLEDF